MIILIGLISSALPGEIVFGIETIVSDFQSLGQDLVRKQALYIGVRALARGQAQVFTSSRGISPFTLLAHFLKDLIKSSTPFSL